MGSLLQRVPIGAAIASFVQIKNTMHDALRE